MFSEALTGDSDSPYRSENLVRGGPDLRRWLIGDSEFRTFFAAMVIITGVFDLIAVAILAGISSGEALSSFMIFVVGWVALLVIIPIAGLILLVPSALTFMTSVKQLERGLGRRRAIQLGAILTTALTSGAFALLASGFGRDWDNIGIAVAAVSLFGMTWAPRIALWAHGNRPSA
ncbi:hypothetical protein [Paracoccus yeei]|uniref:hypothetical protein n=1 Tax=Paracoccus yeei TaxID=147645 RepID=UPI0011C49561|nr:hypothetical protein [Paracoccus yeei]